MPKFQRTTLKEYRMTPEQLASDYSTREITFALHILALESRIESFWNNGMKFECSLSNTHPFSILKLEEEQFTFQHRIYRIIRMRYPERFTAPNHSRLSRYEVKRLVSERMKELQAEGLIPAPAANNQLAANENQTTKSNILRFTPKRPQV